MINFADIGSWHFVTELDVIEVTSASDVSFTIADSGGTILNGTYTPVTGMVRIYHLARLLRPLIDGVTAVFTFTAGSTSKTVHVVQSGVTVSESAATFLPSFFLSAVMTERDTSLERKELLTLLPIEQSLPTVQAVCSYWDGDAVVTANKPITTTGMTANKPFFGYGPDAAEVDEICNFSYWRPHNEYLQHALYLGIPGLFFYLAALLGIGINRWKKLRVLSPMQVVAGGCVVTYLISACFGNTMFYTTPYFWMFLGFLL